MGLTLSHLLTVVTPGTQWDWKGNVLISLCTLPTFLFTISWYCHWTRIFKEIVPLYISAFDLVAVGLGGKVGR